MRTVSRRHVPAQDSSVFQLTWYSFPRRRRPVEPGESRGDGTSPVGTSELQSTGWESICRPAPAPASVNFTGTVAPALTSFNAPSPSTGGWNPPNRAAVQAAGRSKASMPSVLLLELPWLALNPSPRLAKARQISHRFVPPVSATSAVRIALRPSTNPGEQGWNFIPSMTSWMARLFPPVAQDADASGL